MDARRQAHRLDKANLIDPIEQVEMRVTKAMAAASRLLYECGLIGDHGYWLHQPKLKEDPKKSRSV